MIRGGEIAQAIWDKFTFSFGRRWPMPSCGPWSVVTAEDRECNSKTWRGDRPRGTCLPSIGRRPARVDHRARLRWELFGEDERHTCYRQPGSRAAVDAASAKGNCARRRCYQRRLPPIAGVGNLRLLTTPELGLRNIHLRLRESVLIQQNVAQSVLLHEAFDLRQGLIPVDVGVVHQQVAWVSEAE